MARYKVAFACVAVVLSAGLVAPAAGAVQPAASTHPPSSASTAITTKSASVSATRTAASKKSAAKNAAAKAKRIAERKRRIALRDAKIKIARANYDQVERVVLMKFTASRRAIESSRQLALANTKGKDLKGEIRKSYREAMKSTWTQRKASLTAARLARKQACDRARAQARH